MGAHDETTSKVKEETNCHKLKEKIASIGFALLMIIFMILKILFQLR